MLVKRGFWRSSGRIGLLAAAALFLPVAAAPAGAASPDICPVPAETLDAVPPLPAVAAAIRDKKPIAILAVGSASTNAGGQAYPRMALEALQHALPSARFDLRTAGARGLSTVELLPVLRDAIAAHTPTLVLWQTGTVDAVRAVPPDDMADALGEGARLVAAAGADLILIDAQYSRFLADNTDLTPYEDVLRNTASALPDVALFPRFDLMQGWADSGALDLENAPASARAQTAALIHACIGQALARYILSGVSRAAAARGSG